jgi:threonine/homoserine/homoserine lactone efflux protein
MIGLSLPNYDLLLTFMLATITFAWIPRPAMMYTTSRTVDQGKRAGWMAALGIHAGGYVHVIAAALGLALLFETVPVLYIALKTLGAAYLCYIGYKIISSNESLSKTESFAVQKNGIIAFWESATVEILNPKTAIFFIAFLPQFTGASAVLPMWSQFLILGVAVNIIFSIPDAVCVMLSSKVLSVLENSGRASRWPKVIGGSFLMMLGISLLFEQK